MATVVPSLTQAITDQTIFAETFLRILNKDKQIVPLRYFPIQRHSMAHETRRTLKIKPRQPGFTTMEAAKTFKLATTQTITSLTLAHLDVTTQAIRRMAERFYDNWPRPFPKPLRALANDVITTYPDTGSECITATAGSTNVGHGLTINRAHLSEVSRWRNAEEVMQGVLQAVPINGRVVAESTTNGQAGWFYEQTFETLDSANGKLFTEGRNGWSVQFYPWWYALDYRIPLEQGETLDYTEEEAYLIKQHSLSAEQIKWRRLKMLEEKGRFLESYPEDIQTCFISQDGTSVFRGVRAVADHLAISYADYIKVHPDARFIMGVDWGRDNDWSVFTVMDATTWTVVAVERYRHIDWPIQRAYLKTLYNDWHCEKAIVERNSAGDPNISELRREDILVQPFNTTHLTKKQVIDNLTLAIEEKDIHLLKEHLSQRDDVANIVIGELMAYQTKKLPGGDYKYEASSGQHDDCVMSLALALYGCRQMGVRL
jgi:hypothetical protein